MKSLLILILNLASICIISYLVLVGILLIYYQSKSILRFIYVKLKQKLRKYNFDSYIPINIAVDRLYNQIKLSRYWPENDLGKHLKHGWPLTKTYGQNWDFSSEFKYRRGKIWENKERELGYHEKIKISRDIFLMNFLIGIASRMRRNCHGVEFYIGKFAFYGKYKESRLIEIPDVPRLCFIHGAHFERPELGICAIRKIDMGWQKIKPERSTHFKYTNISLKKTELSNLIYAIQNYDLKPNFKKHYFSRFMLFLSNKFAKNRGSANI
jgi:hypothetical protein